MICGSGGSKSRLAKAAGAEPSGEMRNEKLHAVVARSTFRSQNAQSTQGSEHFWKLRCRKSARRCGAKHIAKSKCTKHLSAGPLLEVDMLKKWMPLWREAHFQVKMHKKPQCRTAFGSWHVEKMDARGAKHISKSKSTKHTILGPLLKIQMWFCVAGARDSAPCQKWAQKKRLCSSSKKWCRHGTFEEDLERCMSRGRRSTRDMFIRDVRGSGRWFPQRGCILEHQIFRFAKMILRHRCSTSYDLTSLLRCRRGTLPRWSGEIAKRNGTRPSARHSTFHLSRKSRRIASFLILPTSKIEEVSQNCFVFDVIKVKNWGSLVG